MEWRMRARAIRRAVSRSEELTRRGKAVAPKPTSRLERKEGAHAVAKKRERAIEMFEESRCQTPHEVAQTTEGGLGEPSLAPR